MSTPIRSKITYYMYVGFCFGWVFPCSSSIYRIFYKNALFVILSVAEESSVAKMKINKKRKACCLSFCVWLFQIFNAC